MPKTDDYIKRELTTIGNYKSLKMRTFIGSSNYDQKLWIEGGLTFRYKGLSYGSNDFAWYREEEWIEPETKIKCSFKPVLVVEGTDCLNTRSYGTAQLQRFHHVYGPFMNGNIIGIYYLKEGEFPIRPDLELAVYYANIVENYKERKCAYLVTSKLEDIDKLVRLIGDYGENDARVWAFIDSVLENMKKYYFDNKPRKCIDYEDFLNRKFIYKDNNGDWIKFIGVNTRGFTDSKIRYGHIVLGEIFVAHYLLAGRHLISPNKKLKYYFPRISQEEMAELLRTMTNDKEFNILTKTPYWEILAYENIDYNEPVIKSDIIKFKNSNLNKERKKWNIVRREISNALKFMYYRYV